jgi:hypothetical protein
MSWTRTNVLANRDLFVRASETCRAPIVVAWEVLADLSTHSIWGGAQQRRGRLLNLETTAARAAVGTEFASTGVGRTRRMRDRSVVTEVVSPRILEFVTQSEIETKRARKRADWTVVHRYEIETRASGCRVSHEVRVTRASGSAGALSVIGIRLLRSLAMKEAEAEVRSGLRNLVRMAEERAGAR